MNSKLGIESGSFEYQWNHDIFDVVRNAFVYPFMDGDQMEGGSMADGVSIRVQI